MTEREFIRIQEEVRAIQKRMLIVDAFEGRLDELEKITALLKDSDETIKKEKMNQALIRSDDMRMTAGFNYSLALERRRLNYGIALLILSTLLQFAGKLWEVLK